MCLCLLLTYKEKDKRNYIVYYVSYEKRKTESN